MSQNTATIEKYIHQYQLEDILPVQIHPFLELQFFEKGEYLCHAGDKIDHFHIIVSGKCNVLASSEEGKEVIINHLIPIGINGDIELFIDCPAINSVFAATDVWVIAIDKNVFFNRMTHIRAFMLMLCNSLASKIYTSTQWHSNNMLYSVKVGFSRYLLMSASQNNSHEIHICMTETAQLLGCSTRHLRRILSEYERCGVVSRSRGKICILQQDVLQTQAFSL